MKELSREQKAQGRDGNYKVYTELINRLEDVKGAIKKQNYGIAMDILCKPYPEFQITTSTELEESEDEKIRKALVKLLKECGTDIEFCNTGFTYQEVLAWVEKQGKSIDKEKVLIGARKDVALSIMNFLDMNTLSMRLSNMERADLEDAVVNSDWSKAYDYMKKKLEKQGEQKSADKVEPKFKA